MEMGSYKCAPTDESNEMTQLEKSCWHREIEKLLELKWNGAGYTRSAMMQ